MFHCTNFRLLVIAYSTDLICQNRNIIVMLHDVLAGSTAFSEISTKPNWDKGGIRFSLMFLNKNLYKKIYCSPNNQPRVSSKDSLFSCILLCFREIINLKHNHFLLCGSVTLSTLCTLFSLLVLNNGGTAAWTQQQSSEKCVACFTCEEAIYRDFKSTAWKQPIWFKGSERNCRGKLNDGFLAQNQTSKTLLTL